MKQIFVIADNAFSVGVAPECAAWRKLEPRFGVFAAPGGVEPQFEVEITTRGELPEAEGELIYEPAPPEAGFIAARARRRADGTLELEFLHTADGRPHARLLMAPAMERAEIMLQPGNVDEDAYFLTHALMIAFVMATGGNGTLLVHSSAVLWGGRAYLFQGKSGTGKSTHAAMWLNHIEGTERLNDDNPLLRVGADGVVRAYGSPWSGKTHCYRNVSAPLGAMVRIVRARSNALRRLSPLQGYASVTSSVYSLPFMSEQQLRARHGALERLVATVGCYEMHCLPEPQAALVCRGVAAPPRPSPQGRE